MGTCEEREDVVASLTFRVNAVSLRKVHSIKRVTVILGEFYNPVLLQHNFAPLEESDVRSILSE